MTDFAGRTTDDLYLATVGRLTRGALHEIANPLLALIGTAELALVELEPGTKLHDRFGTVHRTGLEITSIVRALQGFIRLRTEPPRQLSLADAAREAVSLVRLVAASPDVEVGTRVEAEPKVNAAPGAVAASLVELLLAGLAAAQRGGTVEVVVREEGDDAVAALAGGGQLRLPKAAPA